MPTVHVFLHQCGYYRATTITFIICFIAGEKSEPQQFRKYLHIPGVFYNNRRESIYYWRAKYQNVL